MPRGILHATVALSAAGCVGGGAPMVPVQARWAVGDGRPAPSTLGQAVVDASGAMWRAATGAGFDARWRCPDAGSDLRTTPAAAAGALTALGPSPQLAFAAVVVAFSSPARGYAPDDVVDLKGASGARVFFQARALVAPDGHVAWMETAAPDPERPSPWAYLSAIEQPSDDRARLDVLPAALGGDLRSLVASASGGACDVAVATRADLERLGYDLGRDAADLFEARQAATRRKLPRFCAIVARATGPWEVHVSHVEAGFRDPSSSTVASLRARVHLPGGVPCLGPVEVPRVGRDG